MRRDNLDALPFSDYADTDPNRLPLDEPFALSPLPGTGQVTCECGKHRNRCRFGRPHVWFLVPGGDDDADCGTCGARCRP